MRFPAPRQEIPYTEHERIGARLIVAVAFDDAPAGWNATIDDIYVHGLNAWQFDRRVKAYARILCECVECSEGRKINPKMPDQVLIAAGRADA